MISNHPTATALAAVCTLALGLTAQGPFSGLLPKTTFPSDHAPDLANKKLRDGASNTNWFPFSYGKARQMVLYESHDVKIPNANKISHLGFQAEAGRRSKGHSILLNVFMGKSKETAKSMKTTFASNYDGSPTLAYGGTAGKILALPDLGNSLSPNPDSPFVWVPLDTPYTFDSSKNLVVDYRVHANNNSNKPWAYVLDVARLDSPVVKNGNGCKDGSGRIPVLKSRPTSIDSTWNLDLSNAPNSTSTIMLLSFGKAAVPLPFLRPDCLIHIDAVAPNWVPFFFGATTTTVGRYTWRFSIPDDPTFNDVHLYTQALVTDVFATGGFALTNGDDMQIGMNPRMSVLWRQGDPKTITTGFLQRNYGVISHFRH